MLASASWGVSAWSGGCLPGLGGVCLVRGGSAWSFGQGGLLGPGGGVCLVWGGLVWGGGGLPGPRGVGLWSRGGLPGLVGGAGIPACTEADTPPLWTESQTPVKTLPWPNFVAAGKKTYTFENVQSLV